MLDEERANDVYHRPNDQQAGKEPPYTPPLRAELRPHLYLKRYGGP
jgi:hypothetical protein